MLTFLHDNWYETKTSMPCYRCLVESEREGGKERVDTLSTKSLHGLKIMHKFKNLFGELNALDLLCRLAGLGGVVQLAGSHRER